MSDTYTISISAPPVAMRGDTNGFMRDMERYVTAQLPKGLDANDFKELVKIDDLDVWHFVFHDVRPVYGPPVPEPEPPVQAQKRWKNNGELIADVAKLGYIGHDVLDATYGEGTFWKVWQPGNLHGNAYGITNAEDWPRHVMYAHDFRSFPRHWEDSWDTVVLDPPYKLNGTPTESVDARYGVHEPTRWQDRMRLIHDGIAECARVLKPGGTFLLKCQDQVCSGAMRWQTYEFTTTAFLVGLNLIDRFDLLGHARPQPMKGRKQKHAHGRGSTLLVFRKVKA